MFQYDVKVARYPAPLLGLYYRGLSGQPFRVFNLES